MPLSVGDKLGHYEILAPIGRGGMGEVYRARDTTLKRDVALKVLPPELSGNADRIARFQREAEVLASLNHPNIAHLYGLAEADGVRALVMELAEGESPKGPMPFEDAWKIMSQVADGLEYAHERRVVHRDLKPSNLKVSPDGRVKILDFGLAKALSGTPRAAASAGSDSPTLTMGATHMSTQAGVVLGTAAYMAPEQIKGKEADRRADIWAFGVVLYELLTGERPFQGKDSTEIMARAVTADPVLDKAPARVQRLLTACLEKEPGDRLGWIGDARLLLPGPGEQDLAQRAPPPAPQPRNRIWPALATLFAVTSGLFLWLWLRPTPRAPTPVIRIATSLQPPLRPSVNPLVISRDGSRLAYVAGPAGGPSEVGAPTSQIYYRTIVGSGDQTEARPLPGTDHAGSGICFSPDGQQIAYTQGANQLKKITLAGGSIQTLATVLQQNGPAVMDWGDDGSIIYVDSAGLWQIPSTGGTPTSLLKPDPKNTEVFFSNVQRLPGGNKILLTVYKGPMENEVIAFDPQTRAKTPVLKLPGGQPRGQFIPSGFSPSSGYIAYYATDSASVMAVPFDVNRLTVSGVPAPVLDSVATTISGSPFGAFAVSNNGTLVYFPGTPTTPRSSTLLRVDRRGVEEPLSAPPRYYYPPRESPVDPNRIAVAIYQSNGATDIWVYDAARGNLDRISTEGTGFDPVWTADGKRIIYHVSHGTAHETVMWAPADRSAPPSVLADIQGHAPAVPASVSSDGKLLFGSYPGEGKLWTLPLPTPEVAASSNPQPRFILESQFRESAPAISRGDHWLAYVSYETAPLKSM
ncbi:MAG TPA: protein kinase [Bryobacteraceae bacterium]